MASFLPAIAPTAPSFLNVSNKPVGKTNRFRYTPISVQYELTEHGNTLQTIISNLTDWGIGHRQTIIKRQ
ncbi:winged helix-turn-helix transcriptional regulator [Pedobacter hartonius]|uniref:winged helix-turn-helix transcriptional regulator n=1 Tax=Pedobacter hartonius TaxID=425514 RepID=UPI0015872345|nr:winged helix-turn-helix transcriptional regulator [Pedobacter hartonius]